MPADHKPADGILSIADAKAVAFRMGATQSRIQSRIDIIVDRDGSREAAVTGPGFGVGYLLARDIASALHDGAAIINLQADRIAELEAQIAALMPLRTDQPVSGEELIAIGKGLRDAELGNTRPFEEVERSLNLQAENRELRADLERVTKEREEASDRIELRMNQIRQLQDQLAALQQQRGEDTERLDWLEANAGEVNGEMLEDDPGDEDTEMHEGWAVYGTVPCGELKRHVSATADSLRAAIDAARQEKP